MLRHQLSQNFVLLADLRFQLLDPLLVLPAFRPPCFPSQCGVAEQLLLPAVEQAGGQSRFLADLRDRHSFNQMSAQQPGLFFCAPVSAFRDTLLCDILAGEEGFEPTGRALDPAVLL